ncbi:putative O-methyltransferase, partial [Coniochaeta sp. 2T2.1]
MESLTQALTKDVRYLTGYLDDKGYPRPSFERDTPTTVLGNDASQDAQSARERIMSHALQLYHLAAGPSEYLATLQTGYHYIAALQWLCHVKIFDLVPLEGTIDYASLADKAGVPTARLKGILRMAMTSQLFTEVADQQVAHTATSAWLRTNQNSRDWAIFMCDISAPTALAMAAAHQKWPASTARTHTAYNLAFQTDLPFFDHLAQQPERHRQFAGYMQSVTASQGTSLKHLISGFDWESLGDALVVDVGGSTGNTSAALAASFPNLSFIVEDLPEVVAGGPQHLSSLSNTTTTTDGDSRSLSRRIQFRAHSFFDKQPVFGADVYLLRMILHDWPTDDAVRILSALLPALKDGARIVVMDTVLPDPGTVPLAKERLLRVRDLTMLQVFNSCERDLHDWKHLLELVDKRLVLKSVVQPAGSVMSVMEL